MNAQVCYLGDVQRLELKPGDRVVLSVDEVLSDDTARRLKAQAADLLGGQHQVIVLGRGMKIGVLGAE